MEIQEFIQQQILSPRLAKHAVLVIYDPARRYREVCLAMADEQRKVVDTTESSIESRAAALKALGEMGRRQLAQMLVYVPAAKPVLDDDKQQDPFALYGACGDVFPRGDGDEYLSLCLQSKPDYATEIRQIFAQDASPDFAVINAVGGGLNWPNLRALLQVESTRDILFALLVPNDKQQTALKGHEAWTSEAKALLKSSIGLALKTRGKSWSAIADELWRYLLFSEFVFDLPDALPTALGDVPHADASARPLIEDICDRLRNDRRTQTVYIERAEEIENELNLRDQCKHLKDLGERDTFPFEERTFLHRAMQALQADDTDSVRHILSRHAQSVWTGKGESQAQWDLIRSTLALIECCQDMERQLPDHARSMDSLLDFYVGSLREADRLQREFEQTVGDYEWQDTQGVMTGITQQGRKQYGKLIEKVQSIFIKHFETSGWPLSGRLANADVFDRLVAPKLQQSGHKVAYIMVDALRYELGIALEKQLAEDDKVQVHMALAQLPSITKVGMASLLPGAGKDLQLKQTDTGLQPFLGEKAVGSVVQRMDVLKKHYGHRFAEGRLEEFVRKGFEVSGDVDLLVLRSVEIDSYFENHPDTAPTEIMNALKRIRVAINKLKALGFDEVVIATDHGFFMNNHAVAGDTCAKLNGNWLNVHERCLLGDGADDGHHYQMTAEKAGIRGDFAKLAGPRSMASYRSGLLYYHGGTSLQECVVPAISLKLETTRKPELAKNSIVLSYKNNARRITTRLPVLDIQVESQTNDIFADKNVFEILLEAHDRKGNVVGEAKAGGPVNPATGTITLGSGDHLQVTLKMHMEFEGKFKVKVLNPTTLAIYSQIDLETDYTV